MFPKIRLMMMAAILLSVPIMSFLPGNQSDQCFKQDLFVVGENLDVMGSIREELGKLNLEMGEPLRYVPYQKISIDSYEILSDILAIEGVENIIEEASVENSIYVSAKSVKAVPSSNYSPDTAHDLGYRGEGMTIAIIDSGVDNENHPTFIGSFVAGADFSSPESPLNPRDGSVDPDDLDGHGTGVASVALGRGDSTGTITNMGIAPEAGLIDLRIRKLGPTMENPISAALEWCMDNKDTDWGNGFRGVDVISISAGLGSPDGPVHSLIKACVENGMPVISAATNSGEPFESDPNGPNYWSDDSIIVGGTEDKDTVDRSDDEYWPQSTWGPRSDDGDDNPYDELKPDISAPASNIMVAEASDKNSPGPIMGWSVASGTSYATPHVSGSVALMLQANPDLKPRPGKNPIRTILHKTAEARGEPYDDSLSEKYNVHYGYGILDSYEAVREAERYLDSNFPPVIRSLEIVPGTTTVGSECRVTVEAYDPDEDRLTYEISADGGSLTGDYPEYRYIAPSDPGTYVISFTATDTFGASASRIAEVEVEEGEPNRPPRIIELYSIPAEVKVGMTASIIASAEDPDGDSLDYFWESSSGAITGSGSDVDFEAPDQAGTVTIDLRVTDPYGAEDSETLRLTVFEGPVGSSPYIERLSLQPDRIREGTSNVDVIITARIVRMESPIDRVFADISSTGEEQLLELKDDGKLPDPEAEDNEYTGKLPPVKDLEMGTYEIEVLAVDTEGRTSTSSITFTVQAPSENEIEGGNREGIGLNSLLIISMVTIVGLVVIFGVVRLTKRNPS